MTYVAVRISGKPADEEHHYGHGKVESVSALAETALLFLLSGVVIWEAVEAAARARRACGRRQCLGLRRDRRSIVVDFFRARALSRTAKQTSSQALEADALHFASDLWSSLAVLVGLAGVRFGSAVGGFGRGAGRRGARLHRRLAARPPHHRHADRHRAGGRRRNRSGDCRAACPAWSRSSTCARAPSATRPSSSWRVAVSRTLPLDRVNAIKDGVAAAIREQMPGAEPIVTTDPVALDNESVLDRVMVIARNRALAVHHVTVHDIRDRLAVSLDLEVDGKLSLRAAHDIADELEARDRRRARRQRRGRDPYRAAAAARRPPAARRRRSG